MAAPLVTHEIARQAQMLAFNDLFWFIGVVTLAIIPLVLMMKRPEKVSLVPAALAELGASTRIAPESLRRGDDADLKRPKRAYQQILAPEVQT